jgi:hypothetical protein
MSSRLDMQSHEKLLQAESDPQLCSKWVSEFHRSAQVNLLACYIRVVAAKVRSAMPLNPIISQNRVEMLFEDHFQYRKALSSFHQVAEAKIPELAGNVNFFSDFDKRDMTDHSFLPFPIGAVVSNIKRRKEKANRRHQEMMKHLSATSNQLSVTVALVGNVTHETKMAVQSQVEEAEKPIRLIVTLGSQGELLRLQRVEQQDP